MAPAKKDAKANRNQTSNADGEHDLDQEQDGGTQDTGAIDIYSLAVKSMKRQKLRLDYINAMNAIEDDVTISLQNDSKRISKAYKVKARKLTMVLEKRALIEKNIADSLERLETAYIQAANELQLTVAGRIRAAAMHDGNADKSKVAG
ncbi:MAG: hypothetical protein Q9195_008981 [Heterodermia aff. obscurata]